jgi:hypothetical protein
LNIARPLYGFDWNERAGLNEKIYFIETMKDAVGIVKGEVRQPFLAIGVAASTIQERPFIKTTIVRRGENQYGKSHTPIIVYKYLLSICRRNAP